MHLRKSAFSLEMHLQSFKAICANNSSLNYFLVLNFDSYFWLGCNSLWKIPLFLMYWSCQISMEILSVTFALVWLVDWAWLQGSPLSSLQSIGICVLLHLTQYNNFLQLQYWWRRHLSGGSCARFGSWYCWKGEIKYYSSSLNLVIPLSSFME